MDVVDTLRYFYMAEECTPYRDNENPLVRTKEDEAFDEIFITKYHLTRDEMERK